MQIKCLVSYRDIVAGLDEKIPLGNGNMVEAINFDNAATTPPFISVIKAINDFAPWYSSIHRGKGYKSQVSSQFYDSSREIVAEFVNADLKDKTVIYVKNSTEAINKLSNILREKNDRTVVLSSDMEHHSNDLPWRNKYTLDYIGLKRNGSLNINDLERKLIKYDNEVRLVTITGASNVTGYKNDIYKAAELAHRHGAEIMVDGAQLVPHSKMDMKPGYSSEHIDYLVFSGHKMYAPFGTGVLIGPKKVFEEVPPDHQGGGTIDMVTHDFVRWAQVPDKDEAGTPNIMGVVALVEAIKTLKGIGMRYIESYEDFLVEYALKKMNAIPDIKLYGNEKDAKDRVSIIAFNVEGLHHEIVAAILSQEAGIAVRNGCFCAQPYIQRLLNLSAEEIEERKWNKNAEHPGLVRLSFGLYNTCQEIDAFISILKQIVQNKKDYIRKYSISE